MSNVYTPYLIGGDRRRLGLKMELLRKFGSIANAARQLEVSERVLNHLCQGSTQHVSLEVRKALFRHWSSAQIEEMLKRECDRVTSSDREQKGETANG